MTTQGQSRTNQAPEADHIDLAYESKRAEMRYLVPIAEAAEFLGVSRWTVRRMIAAEELTGYRVGGQLRVHKLDLTTAVKKIRPEEVHTTDQKRKAVFERGMEQAQQRKTAPTK